MDEVETDALSQLTAEMAWVRRLARALVRGHDAEDLAQDAWLVAAERPPAEDRPLRPWLGRMTVNLARMRGRSRQRREVRESKVPEPAAAARPDELVQRVELQQLVAGEVLALAEPYRSTVLLHFFEELTCAEIARRLELPEGTVRRRLKVALDELRARIAAREPARRRGGLAALAPLAGLPGPSQSAMPVAVGVIAMKKLLAAVVVLLLLLLAGVLWTRRDPSGPATPATADHHGSAGSAALAAGGGSPVAAGDELPRWLAQPGAAPRRIAGSVTFRGAPIAGATVELALRRRSSSHAGRPRRPRSISRTPLRSRVRSSIRPALRCRASPWSCATPSPTTPASPPPRPTARSARR